MLDVLGDEMKAYEAETRISVPSDTIMVVRVDGRAFHTWTRGLDRPYDPRFNAAMDATALALAEAVSSCVAVYVQSDEISVIASDLASAATEHWFAGGVQKVASVAASAARKAPPAASPKNTSPPAVLITPLAIMPPERFGISQAMRPVWMSIARRNLALVSVGDRRVEPP